MMQITLQNTACARDWRTPRRELPSKINFKIKTPILIVSLIIFTGLIITMTLSFSGKGITKGYTIKQLEAQRQILMRENQIIGSKLAGAQAIQNVVASERIKSMIPVTEKRITYIRGESNLAQK